MPEPSELAVRQPCPGRKSPTLRFLQSVLPRFELAARASTTRARSPNATIQQKGRRNVRWPRDVSTSLGLGAARNLYFLTLAPEAASVPTCYEMLATFALVSMSRGICSRWHDKASLAAPQIGCSRTSGNRSCRCVPQLLMAPFRSRRCSGSATTTTTTPSPACSPACAKHSRRMLWRSSNSIRRLRELAKPSPRRVQRASAPSC